ncbi:chromosome condensation protein CrcB (plasmid) [Halorubrum sp. BOL3-1]|uniref:CrcB family protein n=1 Tax=Halorubrum sp. BOL3-1 TaxID=2497325 RepID=UPI001004F0F2|nr:CrcB family protein [Halorubrum sp. BOL3-1]QAU14501.1 chromosome condensation protein CrcB [Halorubrum sp. BOL3-1]
MSTETHPLVRLESVALIAIGGFAGSNLRYFTGFLLPGMQGTLVVNALGSFALGFVLYETIYSGTLASETRAVISTGFLSSFTTYSTFALQSAQAAPIWLIVNVVANYALGFTGVLVGRSLARLVDRRWS